MGFNFSKGGPPRFKNDNKKSGPPTKDDAPERTVVDKSQNLRDVINEDKASERTDDRRRGDGERMRGGGRGGGHQEGRGGHHGEQQEEEKKQYKIRDKRGDKRPKRNDEYGVEEVTYQKKQYDGEKK